MFTCSKEGDARDHLVSRPFGKWTPPALCRVVLQFQPTNRQRMTPDTTGFMPCGTSISTYQQTTSDPGHHRLYTAWYFNFNLRADNKGQRGDARDHLRLGKRMRVSAVHTRKTADALIPPALCRVVLGVD